MEMRSIRRSQSMAASLLALNPLRSSTTPEPSGVIADLTRDLLYEKGFLQKIDGFVIEIKNQTDVAPELLKPIYGLATEIVIKKELLDLLPQICEHCKLRAIDVLKLYLPSAIRTGKPKRNGKRRVPVGIEQSDKQVVLNTEQQFCVNTV